MKPLVFKCKNRIKFKEKYVFYESLRKFTIVNMIVWECSIILHMSKRVSYITHAHPLITETITKYWGSPNTTYAENITKILLLKRLKRFEGNAGIISYFSLDWKAESL